MPLYKPEDAHVLRQFDLTGTFTAMTGGVRGIGQHWDPVPISPIAFIFRAHAHRIVGLEAARELAEAGSYVALNRTHIKHSQDIASSIAEETVKI